MNTHEARRNVCCHSVRNKTRGGIGGYWKIINNEVMWCEVELPSTPSSQFLLSLML